MFEKLVIQRRCSYRADKPFFLIPIGEEDGRVSFDTKRGLSRTLLLSLSFSLSRDSIYIETHTYGNGIATGAGILRGLQLAPALEEALDVASATVDDAEPGDVDGTELDHLALPAVVHYLIKPKRQGNAEQTLVSCLQWRVEDMYVYIYTYIYVWIRIYKAMDRVCSVVCRDSWLPGGVNSLVCTVF